MPEKEISQFKIIITIIFIFNFSPIHEMYLKVRKFCTATILCVFLCEVFADHTSYYSHPLFSRLQLHYHVGNSIISYPSSMSKPTRSSLFYYLNNIVSDVHNFIIKRFLIIFFSNFLAALRQKFISVPNNTLFRCLPIVQVSAPYYLTPCTNDYIIYIKS